MSRARIAALALASLLIGAASAHAATPSFQRCSNSDPGSRCARLVVPIDRSGAVPGSISLLVRTRSRSLINRPRKGVVVALAGGPGQAATPLLDDFSFALAPALRTRDLVVFDQRGTGGSGLLRCPGLESAFRRSLVAESFRQLPGCAASLGTRRSSYTTEDSVADIEDMRLALGVDKLALAGVSYGTKVAEAYAIAHPTHVELLVLDSVVTPDGPDVFERSNLTAVPRVLRSICSGRGCRFVTADPVADLSRVLARVRARTLRSFYFDAHGRRHTATVTPRSLLDTLYEGDFDPVIRAGEPAALRALLRGDRAQLMRLYSRARESAADYEPQELSNALFVATTCEETPFPWTRTAPAAERLADLRGAAAAIPDSEFAPFKREDELASDVFGLCARWLAAPPRFVPSGPLPDVPALILSGGEDMRTPVEDARIVARQLPHGRLLFAPVSGHSVATSEQSPCARRALEQLLAGTTQSACPRGAREVPPSEIAPLRVPSTSLGIGPRRGRTLIALLLTVADLDEQASYGGNGGGLRGGFFTSTATTVGFRRYVYVPGYVFAGRIGERDGTLQVSGSRAALGTVRITTKNHIVGRLGGKRIDVSLDRLVAAARSGQGFRIPTLRLPSPRPAPPVIR